MIWKIPISPNTDGSVNSKSRGYHRGTITGRNGYRFIIELSSGARIELYNDEIEFD